MRLAGRLPSPITLYLGFLVVTGSALALALSATGQGIPNVWILAVLALAAAVADRGTVRLSTSVEVSVALLPGLFAAIVLGPLSAMIVGAASMISDLRPQPDTPSPFMKWSIYTLSRAITCGLAGTAALVSLASIDNRIGAIALSTAVAVVVAVSLDVCFVSVTMRLRRVGGLLDGAKVLGPVVASSIPLYAPILAFLAFSYTEISPWTLPLFVVPALAAQRLFVLYQDQRRLTEDLFAANARLEHANLSFASGLVATLDARDQYTAGHSAAVAIYAQDIAARMGLDEKTQKLAHLCGLVHDIGKIGLPPGLLEKRGPMTLEERRAMERHCAIGERILVKVDGYSEIATIVRHHHERWDGFGYPDGLAGEDIPLISRIIAVADAYNAMTSDRPYRSAMPSRVARLRLAQAVESQFDTAVVAAFEAILASASESYRNGERGDFRLEEQNRNSLKPVTIAASA